MLLQLQCVEELAAHEAQECAAQGGNSLVLMQDYTARCSLSTFKGLTAIATLLVSENAKVLTSAAGDVHE